MDPLTERDRAMLDMERQWWATAGRKEAAIRDRFGMSATRYYQLLSSLLGTEAAMAYDPVTVKRLLRVRSAKMDLRKRPRRGIWA
ncbi:DUF3263 domain-containing protein [Mycolicibacterium smegmatis]|uniref:DUF3263 domain-containing protein n=1 Tax=Mycolicibacterium smegmatis TaxID=1772 RepID=UPI001E38A6C2|nr:DUF3263 domain-containing protein [Mycolicibacterium smegmatis]UGU31366.1 DUF3263 domain-containing protein [Mycolicibacterium smegmatis]